MVKTYELYGGKYKLEFHEGNHRYNVNGQLKKGVTGILGKTLAKEGLALWPLDEAMRYLFGQEFEEVIDENGDTLVKPKYNGSKAFLRTSTVLDAPTLQACLEDARNAHIKKRDKGADTGHQVHSFIEQFLTAGINQEQLKEAPVEVKKAIAGFLDWYKGEDTILAERPLYSEKFDYCGTVDHILRQDDVLTVRDYKTTNASRTAPVGIYAENFAQLGAYAQAYEEEFNLVPQELEVVNVSKQGKVVVIKASEVGLTVEKCKQLWINLLHLHNDFDGLRKVLTNVSKEKIRGVR